jgi:hypothetical protein
VFFFGSLPKELASDLPKELASHGVKVLMGAFVE